MKILSVQYLRAIAALLVLFHHMFWPPFTNNFALINYDLEVLGVVGVDLFFVLSGFIISYIIQFEKSPALFIRKRMARIYPTYWQVYLLAILLWLILRGIFKIQFMPHGSWFSNISLLPFERVGNSKPVLIVAWTLYYEVFFYIVVAICLRFFGGKIYPFIILLFFLPDSFFGFYKIFFYEFILGFVLMESIKRKNVKMKISLSLIASLLIFLLTSHSEIKGFAAMFAIIFLSSEKMIQKLPKSKLLEKIGDASYSLYLIHFPLCGLANYFASKINNPWVMSAYVLAWMGLIVWLAILNYEKFEKPIALKLKKYINPKTDHKYQARDSKYSQLHKSVFSLRKYQRQNESGSVFPNY